jgi:hypothetical protein
MMTERPRNAKTGKFVPTRYLSGVSLPITTGDFSRGNILRHIQAAQEAITNGSANSSTNEHGPRSRGTGAKPSVSIDSGLRISPTVSPDGSRVK